MYLVCGLIRHHAKNEIGDGTGQPFIFTFKDYLCLYPSEVYKFHFYKFLFRLLISSQGFYFKKYHS